MELDSHLLGLSIAAEQQHSIISHWESRNNKLYKASRESSMVRRPGTDTQFEEVDDGSKNHKNIKLISMLSCG